VKLPKTETEKQLGKCLTYASYYPFLLDKTPPILIKTALIFRK